MDDGDDGENRRQNQPATAHNGTDHGAGFDIEAELTIASLPTRGSTWIGGFYRCAVKVPSNNAFAGMPHMALCISFVRPYIWQC